MLKSVPQHVTVVKGRVCQSKRLELRVERRGEGRRRGKEEREAGRRGGEERSQKTQLWDSDQMPYHL